MAKPSVVRGNPPARKARGDAARVPAPRRQAGGARASARERLLDAAETLFYEEGINTVGIDRVIERAGVAKASL